MNRTCQGRGRPLPALVLLAALGAGTPALGSPVEGCPEGTAPSAAPRPAAVWLTLESDLPDSGMPSVSAWGSLDGGARVSVELTSLRIPERLWELFPPELVSFAQMYHRILTHLVELPYRILYKIWMWAGNGG